MRREQRGVQQQARLDFRCGEPLPTASSVRRILIVHQSAELYGSDRSLLDLLQGVDRHDLDCIVCLPGEGPLALALRSLGLEVHILPLLKISRNTVRGVGVFSLVCRLPRAMRALDLVIAGRHIDLVYTNTLAVLDGMFWSRLRRRPHVWHVREIITKPRFVSLTLRLLIRVCANHVVCNSLKTREWLAGSGRSHQCRVVWNGVQNHALIADDKAGIRQQLGLQQGRPVLLMVGRINQWKGQDLLLEAVALLDARGCHQFQLVILGGPSPGQENLQRRLQAQVATSPVAAYVALRDFVADPSPYYRAADCLVVPSREPEPFGRVAIEAMARGLPVVAANHGGLTEIVRDRETGILVAPNDAKALADALEAILADEAARSTWGQNGHARQQALFSLTSYRMAMMTIFQSALA